MQFDLIDSETGLASLGTEWEALEGRALTHLFQSHAFLNSWYACAGKASEAVPAVVTAREGGRLVGVLPACVITKGGIRFLTWLGGFFAVDYGDVLLDPASSLGLDPFLDQALRLLRERIGFHIGYFHNLRHDAVAYPYFKRHFVQFRSDVAPYVPLQNSFDSYLDSLKRFRKKQKSDTLRQIKRLSELGELEFREVRGEQAEVQALLEAFFAQKRWRFQISGVHGVLFHPGYEEFYRDQAKNNGAVHLSMLTLNGEIIATHVGYLYHNSLYFVMPSYDHRFGKYSPGRVLTYYLIRDCFERGVECFDFCIGSEEYKYEWTDQSVPVTSFVSDDLQGKIFTMIKKGKIRGVALWNSFRGRKP